MEEEYRMQKAQTDIRQVAPNGRPVPSESSEGDAGRAVIYEDGTVLRDSMDDRASTRAIISPPSPEPSIPTIKISSSDQEHSEGSETQDEETPEEGDIVATPNKASANGVRALVEKPVQATGEDKQDSSDIGASPAEPFSFSNKRLCERWLDNLFMVLYEVSTVSKILFSNLFSRYSRVRRT